MTRVDPINRALVFIEGQLAENLGVDEIARASRISRYQLNILLGISFGILIGTGLAITPK